MTPVTWVKIGLGLLLAAALVIGAKQLHDNIFERGVQQERAAWQQRQAEADLKMVTDERAGNLASEQVTDQAAAKADQVSRGTITATEKSLERIEYVYIKDPSKADGCTADGRPAAIDPGILRELDAASAAVAAAAATPSS